MLQQAMQAEQAEVHECPGFLRRIKSLYASTDSLSEMRRALVISLSPSWNKLEHLIMSLLRRVLQQGTDREYRSPAKI
jgi:hypothetical protein